MIFVARDLLQRRREPKLARFLADLTAKGGLQREQASGRDASEIAGGEFGPDLPEGRTQCAGARLAGGQEFIAKRLEFDGTLILNLE